MKPKISLLAMLAAALIGCSSNPRVGIENSPEKIVEIQTVPNPNLPDLYRNNDFIFTYKKGDKHKPDMLEIRTKNYEMFELFEDANHDGIIGDEEKDAYTSFILKKNQVGNKELFTRFSKCKIDFEEGNMYKAISCEASDTKKYLDKKTMVYQQIKKALFPQF